jgi:hypothetical protein
VKLKWRTRSGACTEVMVVREGLEQACIELESAIGAVRRRLRGLSVKPDQVGFDHNDRSATGTAA